MPNYVRYSDDVETFAADEAETFQKIVDVMAKGMHNVKPKAGEAVRVSHSKAHGFVKGELIVDADLPPELAQGLFARAGSHPVIVRLATVPGENLDDRKVSTPRGMAIKVLNAEGPKLPGHEGSTTQDFVLDTGKAFLVGTADAFLQAFKPNALIAPHLPEAAKGVTSAVSLATNKVLNAVGLNSAKLDFYGHPKYHPLAEAYYSQCAIRYGDYVAKLSITPANPALEALYERVLDITDENGLRLATVEYFRTNDAVYDVNIQLCTDTETMPVEDASVEWPEDQSPYRRVAKLVLPAQNAYDPARQDVVDHQMSFSPAHSLAAHRPLGSIMRARMAVYPALANMRRSENANKPLEPSDITQVPG